MSEPLRIVLAQINLVVGDVSGNTARMQEAIGSSRLRYKPHLIVFPELALCGYPPEDLLFHSGLGQRVNAALDTLRAETRDGPAVLVGYPEYHDGRIYNAAAWLQDGELRGNYRKHCLPNYGVFDEARYFTAGSMPLVLELAGYRVGVTICEDNWDSPAVAQATVAAGAELIVSINGSPFELGKQAMREARLARCAQEAGVPMVYQNLVGGQDELVFDGGSCLVDVGGELRVRAPAFREGLYLAELERGLERVTGRSGEVTPLMDETALIYQAVLTGVRDYVHKNGFGGIVLGLSGGVDSALCLALAVDALGADAVQAVMMPYHYTSAMSLEDAAAQAEMLGVNYRVLPIADMVAATCAALGARPDNAATDAVGKALNDALNAGMKDSLSDTADILLADGTVQNIQARCRGMLLMALSNNSDRMVLTTGNKSEMAVGYATLYGDMAGGFAPIKDCTKTLVYRLAHYRNSLSAAIPQRVLEREPSAELRPDQKDSDSLPPYEELDPILDALMIEDLSVEEIAARGFEHDTVGRVLDMVRRNEYKRRQSPPGVRISGRAFGRDWRYPITSGYGRSRG